MNFAFGFSVLLLLVSAPTFAGELFLAQGISSSPTPMTDQSELKRLVMASAISNAERQVAGKKLKQVSSWHTSYSYAGSRIYGFARASFKNSEEQAPWFVTTPGKYLQIYKSEIEGDEIASALLESRVDAQARAAFYCAGDALTPDRWEERVEEDLYKILYTVQVKARFQCL